MCHVVLDKNNAYEAFEKLRMLDDKESKWMHEYGYSLSSCFILFTGKVIDERRKVN